MCMEFWVFAWKRELCRFHKGEIWQRKALNVSLRARNWALEIKSRWLKMPNSKSFIFHFSEFRTAPCGETEMGMEKYVTERFLSPLPVVMCSALAHELLMLMFPPGNYKKLSANIIMRRSRETWILYVCKDSNGIHINAIMLNNDLMEPCSSCAYRNIVV